MADHDRERIVELVGDAGEQRAERAHLLVLMQDLALPGELGLDPLALGQIDHRGDHGVLAFEGDQPRGERRPELGAVGAAQADLQRRRGCPRAEPGPSSLARSRGIGVEPERGAGAQLVERHAQEPRARRAGEDDLAGLDVGDEQRHRVGLGERAEALLAGLERLLHRLALGDVDVEAADMADAAVGVAHREPDHQVPDVLVLVRQVLLGDDDATGAQHLAIARHDEVGGVRPDRAVDDGPAEHLLDVGCPGPCPSRD